ncbi:hypothetical protein BpHYR1_040342 [Brachionus plicatilis]|uniref:Uncharacterized protein n=1 Tax=Brachionus plicatilis TaxID=10195 RepID=A0A3M7PLI1_BRAPC|nr:hypothetical protein BpHYR1_040342 [Brachionus plicatilis]
MTVRSVPNTTMNQNIIMPHYFSTNSKEYHFIKNMALELYSTLLQVQMHHFGKKFAISNFN